MLFFPSRARPSTGSATVSTENPILCRYSARASSQERSSSMRAIRVTFMAHSLMCVTWQQTVDQSGTPVIFEKAPPAAAHPRRSGPCHPMSAVLLAAHRNLLGARPFHLRKVHDQYAVFALRFDPGGVYRL